MTLQGLNSTHVNRLVYTQENGNITVTCTALSMHECVFSGTSSSTRGETDPKGIIVNNAATLEIHGEPKLSWTKITQSVVPLADTDDLTFEHSVRVSVCLSVFLFVLRTCVRLFVLR